MYGDGVPELLVDAGSLYVYNFDDLSEKAYGRRMDLHRCTGLESLRYSLLVFGDLNEDGIDDIVALGEKQIWSLIYDRRHGTFVPAAEEPFEGPLSPYRAWLGDHSGDGLPDLLVSDNSLNETFIFEGLGDGRWGGMYLITELEGRSYAAGWAASNLWILTNSGLWSVRQGNSVASKRWEVAGQALALFRLGEADRIHMAVGTYNGLEVLSTNGEDLELVARYPEVRDATWMCAADINGDDYDDIVCGSQTSTGYWVLFGGSDGSLYPVWQGGGTAEGVFAMQPSTGVTFDANSDGRDEIAMISFPSMCSIQSPTPTGISRQRLPGVMILGSGDIDEDGFEDLLVDGPDGEILGLINERNGRFLPQDVVEKPGAVGDWMPIRAALVKRSDGFGSSLVVMGQLLAAHEDTPALAVWERTSGEWSQPQIHRLPVDTLPILEIVDLNQDGTLELATVHDATVSILKLENVASGFAPREIDLPGRVAWMTRGMSQETEALFVGVVVESKVAVYSIIGDRLEEVPIDLEMIPMDAKAVDTNGDGLEELALVGLRVDEDSAEAQFEGAVAVIRFGPSKASVVWEEAILGWTKGTMPLPLLGTTVVNTPPNEPPELAVLQLGNGAASSRLARVGLGKEPRVRWTDNVDGLGLVALDADGDGWDEVIWKLDAFAPTLGVVPGRPQ